MLSCLAPKEPRWLCKDRECDLPITAARKPISESYGTLPEECATFHMPALWLGMVCIDNRHRFLRRKCRPHAHVALGPGAEGKIL